MTITGSCVRLAGGPIGAKLRTLALGCRPLSASSEPSTPPGSDALLGPESSAVPRASGVRAARALRAAPAFGITLALFVFSGMTGLIDQLCFSKYLSYVVGSTAHAVSAVLAAFMTGLALGAHLGGKASARVRRPLLAYGVLELLVAFSVALSPLAFRALTPLYVALAGAAPGSLALVSGLRWLLGHAAGRDPDDGDGRDVAAAVASARLGRR